MARDNNTFAKRQREMLKKRKADDKRARRQKKKDDPTAPTPLASDDVPANPEDDPQNDPPA